MQLLQARQTLEQDAEVLRDDLGPAIERCAQAAQGLAQVPLQVQPEMIDAFAIHPLGLVQQLAPALLQVQPLELRPVVAARRRQAGVAVGILRGRLMHRVPTQALHQPVRGKPTLGLTAQVGGQGLAIVQQVPP
ncbi:hypothetical protein D3C77_614230 [compost metagenome]